VIRRSTKIQLGAFLIISVLGIFYVGTQYVGFHFFSAGPYPVTLVLPESGGIFPNAEVTERGVTVGRVGSMDPANTPDQCGGQSHCVRVQLNIDHSRQIPSDLHATVANLSAVGEQYVDLEPNTASGPYLQSGSVITADNATVPPSDAKLLLHLDQLLNSVNRQHLATVISQLGKGFQDLGPSLQALIDNGNRLTTAAIRNLPAQLQLIDDSVQVLDTQRAVSQELQDWAASFASFSDQLRQSDPAIRGVLDNGVVATHALTSLLRDNEPVLPTLLGNLVTFNQIQAVRIPYVRAALELFPSLTAAGFYVTPGDGTAHFGMVNDMNGVCTQGYESTKIRGNNENNHNAAQDWGGPANLDAYCHGPAAANDWRGSRFTPRPDNAQVTNSDPYPGPRYGHSSHPTVAQQHGMTAAAPTSAAGGADPVIPIPYDPVTGLLTGLDGKTYQLGYSGPLEPIFGSSSWKWLLIAPTMR
jgi:phospholipid/cholesterol/gamma-HCH transport system substrate-binding protein